MVGAAFGFLASQDVSFALFVGGIEEFFFSSAAENWATTLHHWILYLYTIFWLNLRRLNWAEWWFLCLAIGNCLSGFDDLFIDSYYWTTYALRRLKYPRKRFPLLTEDDLLDMPQKRGAIFIAAWKEDDVIEEMLITNSTLINYQNFDFFVACYPNDEPTLNKVRSAVSQLPNVVAAVNPKPGPSNKADNLNAAFLALKRREQELNIHYDFIVMHDPEDILHPLEMRLYNYLLHKRDPDMIQTPIFPLAAPWSHFTASSYMDEFAETHTKDIYVREWLRGFVPSAGVGTCIQRRVLDRLSDELGPAKIFNTESLTEDYDFGLRLKLKGGKAIFVRQFVWRTRDQAGHRLTKPYQEMIATRAHFPATFYTALRQRTRWMVGIVFQNWQQFGWVGDMRTRWLLFHDRKGLWANTLVMFNYLFLLVSTFHMSLRWLVWPGMSPMLSGAWWVKTAFVICVMMMLNRIAQRAIATCRIYGWQQGCLSFARLAWDNLINISVTFRAAHQFVASELQGAKIAWDKTQHFFPTEGEVGGNAPNYLEAPQQIQQAMAAKRAAG